MLFDMVQCQPGTTTQQLRGGGVVLDASDAEALPQSRRQPHLGGVLNLVPCGLGHAPILTWGRWHPGAGCGPVEQSVAQGPQKPGHFEAVAVVEWSSVRHL